ncbi:hypothetical protein IIU_07029 [Bacillus cereus VD133]|uniref:Uncharacterized protein n=1 Tax=Bacillus cereus VD133 TaxID=1053233 RepID=A0A9W5PJ59_BACCE|nr:hypothetical protein IIU_07029 [Bacillus cereus VD133]
MIQKETKCNGVYVVIKYKVFGLLIYKSTIQRSLYKVK